MRLFAFALALGLVCACFGDPGQRTFKPGDRIQIQCEQDQSLSVVRRVGSDGTIDLPLVGSVRVAARTAEGAAAHIQETLIGAGWLENGTIKVESLFTPGDPIGISGAVAHRMELRFVNEPDLKSLLKLASPVANADLSHVFVSHADGSSVELDANATYLRLLDGDRVVVPFNLGPTTVEVAGGVQSPASVPFHTGLTLGDALSAAGGFTTRADKEKIVVTRRDEPIPASMPRDSGMVLKPGDTVSVSVIEEDKYVAIQGDVVHPGLIDLVTGMTVTQAIEAAGGLKRGGTGGSVTLKNVLDPASKPQRLSLNFIYDKRIPDPVLSADEVIEVHG